MARISKSVDSALNVIALASVASHISKEVEGMAGFAAFYEKELPAVDKAVLRRYRVLCKEAVAQLASAFGQEEKPHDGR